MTYEAASEPLVWMRFLHINPQNRIVIIVRVTVTWKEIPTSLHIYNKKIIFIDIMMLS